MEETEETDTLGDSYSEQWSNDKLNQLISLYSKERLLWDTSLSATQEQRQEAHERISSELDCDIFDVIRKIRHLRTYYGKILRDEAQNGAKKRGKQWAYYNQLEFLRDHFKTCTRSSRKKERIVYDDGSPPPLATGSESSSDTFTTTQQQRLHSDMSERRHRKRQKHTAVPKIKRHSSSSNTSATHAENGSVDDMDPDEIFGRHVTNELRLIRGMREKQFAKLQINNILFNAQFGLVKIPENLMGSLS